MSTYRTIPAPARSRAYPGPRELTLTIVSGGLAIFLALEMGLSLWWRPVHDSAHLNYIAWLVGQHGLVPYQDVFETTFPGALLFHLLIGWTVGFGDLAFRLVDIALMLVLFGLTAWLMRPLGSRVALLAAVLFGILYLSHGPSMSLQRDYLGIFPIVGALLVAGRAGRPNPRAFAIGALFGVAMSIKPHLGLGLPAVLVYGYAQEPHQSREQPARRWAGMASVLLMAVAGVVTAFSLPLIWVWQTGGLAAWWAIVARYLPLYIQMNGAHEIVTGLDHWLYLLNSYQTLGGRAALMLPVGLGVYLALFESRLVAREKRLVLTLTALTFLYGIYPVLAGQFWAYHWMPFFYFATLSASLILVPLRAREQADGRRRLALAVFLYALALLARPAPDFFRQITGQEPRPPKDGRVDEMAAFLRRELRPGDTVQPLDWIDGGTAQAMLLAGAMPATRYLYDAQFYHHLSNEYIQGLRSDFIAQLRIARPRFILDIPNQSRPTGYDTASDFPALEELIHRHYTAVQWGDQYVIYERTR